MIAEIGVQVADIARTQGEIAGLQAQANPEALAATREALRAKGTLNPTAGEITKQAFDTAMKPFGTGSSLQQGLQAATAAIQGIAGGSVAQAGKTTVENNALGGLEGFGKGFMDYGQATATWNQYAETNGLTPEQKQAGLNSIAVGEGPSWGTEYKVKPNEKVEVSGGVGLALKGGAEINNDYFSISTGYTKEFGIKAGASIGIDFGPYFPGFFGDINRDYSTSVGFGPGSVGMSGGKDGIGISFSIGPSIGFTSSATGSHDEKIDLNGDSTREVYHYDFK